MCGQVRRVQTCSDYQVKGDKKRGACRSQGRSSSTVQWDDVENKVCTYRNRFLSKNSLWIIMSWARKDFPFPNIETVITFLAGFRSSEESLFTPARTRAHQSLRSQTLLSCSCQRDWQLRSQHWQIESLPLNYPLLLVWLHVTSWHLHAKVKRTSNFNL